MRDAERAALAAVTFLTRVPVARRVALEGSDLARGAVFFPLVGAGVGAAVGGAAYGLAQVVPALVAAGIALALGALLTGALHLDALADTADAAGTRTREAALAIMRDHHTGAFGATALALDLLVKAAALAALVGHPRVVLYALAAGALSRSVAAVLGAMLPAARTDGAGAAFRVPAWAASTAVLAGAALAFVVPWQDALALCAVAAWMTVAAALLYRRWLGGVTGDTLGAAVEVAETALLAAAAGLA